MSNTVYLKLCFGLLAAYAISEASDEGCKWNEISYPCELDSSSLSEILTQFNVYKMSNGFKDDGSSYTTLPENTPRLFANRVVKIAKAESEPDIYNVVVRVFNISVLDGLIIWEPEQGCLSGDLTRTYLYKIKKGCLTCGVK